jgi:beta-lactamase regulating signal transducer with metallopeptidase domain
MMASPVSASTFSLIPGLVRGLFPSLLDAALRSLVVAGAVWAGLRLLRAHNVVAQKAAWGLVLAGALLMPVVAPWAARLPWLPAQATLVVPAQPWLRALPMRALAGRFDAAPQTASARPQASSPSADLDAAPLPAVPLARAHSAAYTSPAADRFPAPAILNSYPATATTPERIPTPKSRPRLIGVDSAAWLVYLGICGALLLRLVYGVGAAIRLWRASEPVQIESAPHLTRGLHVRSSRKLTSPVTVGSGIVLPAAYAGWDPEKLRIVLAHERSHVRQGDFYLQLCAGLYAALFWFSPLGWWLKRTLSDLSEAISDRAGLFEAANRASYAQVLLEFAALPRTTQLGVAMARPGRLTHRIERLLNESSFRQAFAGSRRTLVALLLIPAALFAATALIRVQAAGQEPQPPAPALAPAAPQAPNTGQSHPDDAQEPTEPPPPASGVAPVPPAPQPAPAPAPSPRVLLAPEPPEPPDVDNELIQPLNGNALIFQADHGEGHGHGRGYSYSYRSNGDSYAIIKGDGKQVQFSGDWHDGRHAEIDKARRMAHGDFLWFTRNGKSYILDDAAQVAQIEGMYKPMEDLGRQQELLGRAQVALGRDQEKLGEKEKQASIPTPDISKEMAALNAEAAKLQATKSAMMTTEQFAELESKIGELQGKLGHIQGEMIGARMSALGEQMGKLGAQMGTLGAEQGRLGAEQGRIAAEADRKVKSIIDEALRDGKAKPVQ